MNFSGLSGFMSNLFGSKASSVAAIPSAIDVTPRFGALSGTDLTVPGLATAKDFSQVGLPSGGFTPPKVDVTPQTFGSGAMKGLASFLGAMGQGGGQGTPPGGGAVPSPGVIAGRAPGSFLDMIRKLQSLSR